MSNCMKRSLAFLSAAFLAALAAACAGTPAPDATPNPDKALLAGRWEQFIPVESLPQTLELETSGGARVDGEACTWRLRGDTLYIGRGGAEKAYGYTVSGYMLTLTCAEADASDFYINPERFADGADDNARFKGRWGGFSTFGMMDFDGAGGLTDIVYTTAGRADLPKRYAARDGILQSADADGNHTYNLYAFSPEGALLLAETPEYDELERQWSPHWKKSEPGPAMLGNWTMAFDTQPGAAGFPAQLQLGAGGAAKAGTPGFPGADIRWEYYNGGFLALMMSDADLRYAWCESAGGGVLFLGNPDADEAWYYDDARYKPTVEALADIAGIWREEEGGMALEVRAGGTVLAADGGGKETELSAQAAGGLMRLRKGDDTWYMAYDADDGEMSLWYGGAPFFGEREMPARLIRD